MKKRKFWDLSRELKTGMPAYPDDVVMERTLWSSHEKEGCQVSRLVMSSHTGTHVDAPLHYVAGGRTIDAFPPEYFEGKGVVLRINGKQEEEAITAADLKKYDEMLCGAEVVLLSTGWEHYWEDRKYLHHPYLSREAAAFLRSKNIRIVGTDCLSIDHTLPETTEAHMELLGHEILVVENLCGLDALPAHCTGTFQFLPLKIAGSDGAPCRAVYWEEQE